MEEELPWWTDEEMDEAAAKDVESCPTTNPLPIESWQIHIQQAAEDRNLICFRPKVLDKYRSNRYCDIGYDKVNGKEYISIHIDVNHTFNTVRDYRSVLPSHPSLNTHLGHP
jgi:hypothetical protein